MSSTSVKIAEGDRICATETISYCVNGLIDIFPGDEGTVINLTDDDGWPLIVEWDAGLIGAAASESVALVPPLAR